MNRKNRTLHGVWISLWILGALSQSMRGEAQAQIIGQMDIPYVAGGERKQQWGLYIPEEQEFSTLLLVHGGSMANGDRKDTSEPYGELARTFAREGMACAAMSYRLFPTVDWSAPAEDVAAAFVWLRRNIETHGGSAERIFILGHSSGGLLSAVVASDPRFLEKHGLSTKDIAGVLPMGCRLNWDDSVFLEDDTPEEIQTYFREDLWGKHFGSLAALKSFRPINHVGAHLPPTLVLIAKMERFQPPILEDAAIFVGAAGEAGVDADLAILPDRNHFSSIRQLVSPEDFTFRLIVSFIQRLSRSE
jgi:arylformamidase